VVLRAKGICRPQSKLKGHLDVYDLSDFIIVPGRYRPFVRSVVSIQKFVRLKQDLMRTALASVVMELFDKGVFENERDDALWEGLYEFLYAINVPVLANPEAFLKKYMQNFFLTSGIAVEDDIRTLSDASFIMQEHFGADLHALNFFKEMIQ